MLSSNAKAILQLLVNRIRAGRITPDDEQTFVGYKEVHDEVGIKRIGFQWGASLSKQGLGELAQWLHKNGRPAITGLIVDQANFSPGEGYYEVNERPPGDRAWWMHQVREAVVWDWSADVEDDHVPTESELQDFTQAVNEGRLVTVSVTVRERCEALKKRARLYYLSPDGKLRCEVCGWYKPSNLISGDIVEFHHIRPLAKLPSVGTQSNLADAIKSLAPLCPCCHRIAHAKRDDRPFTLDELKQMIPQSAHA
ncbi:MAG: hypothetical protein EPO07_18495 [Verrucomicrobia bacterium]|nr:MAG: hypothetical protein EPO07_18495 [Verrucomicrobiota bacterium]